MVDYDAGSASIKVRPNLRGFRSELQSELRRIDAGFGVSIGADFTRFGSELKAGLQRYDASLDVEVRADTAGALAEVEAFKQIAGGSVTVDVDVDTKKAAKSVGDLKSSLSSAGVLNLGAVAIGNLPAAATSIASVSSALADLSGTALLLPGILATAGAGAATLAVGLNGMKDAFSDSPKKAAEAYAKLSETGKDTVDTVKSLGDEWSNLADSVQDKTLDGVSEKLRTLAKNDLPELRKGMEDVATQANGGLKRAFDELSNQSSQDDMATIFKNTATSIGITNAAVVPLLRSFRTLATIGSNDVPQLAQGFTNLATRFDAFVARTEKSGDLARWMQEGIDSAKTLGSGIGNIGSSIASVIRASGDSGQGLLKTFDDLTEKMATFLKSDAGQDKLKSFFEEGRRQLGEWRPILQDLGPLLKSVYDATHTWSGIVMPFLQAASGLLAAHPGLVRDVVIAYLAFKTVSPILDAVRGGLAGASGVLGSFKGKAADTAGAGGIGKLSGAAGGLMGMFAAGGPWGIALGAGVTAIGLLASAHQEAADKAEAQRQKEEALQATLDKQTGKVTQETLNALTDEFQKDGTLDRAESFGVDTHQLVQASGGLDQRGQDSINARLTPDIVKSLDDSRTFRRSEGALLEQGISKEDTAKALQGIPEYVDKYTAAVEKANVAIAASGDKGRALVGDLHQMKQSLSDTGESAATLGGKMNEAAAGTDSAAARQAQYQQAAAGSFQLTYEGVKSFHDLGLAVESVPDEKTVVVKTPTEEQERKLRDLGYTVTHMEDGTVKVTLDDEQAKNQIRELQKPGSKTITVNVNEVLGSYAAGSNEAIYSGFLSRKYATGGHVRGPGSTTSDSILARLSDQEFVSKASSVQKYGVGFYNALNDGRIDPSMLPGYAEGGLVATDKADRGKNVASYAKSLNGQPYGGALDCSGFQSQLVNIADGREPLSSRFSTANEGEYLAAAGWKEGMGGAGTYRLGWVDDPSMPGGGHTAGTLANNVNVESGGATSKVMYGGKAIGFSDPMFTRHAYLDMSSAKKDKGKTGGKSGSEKVSVLHPQAELPTAQSDSALQLTTSQMSVDQANSERNKVYADPESTDEDKKAADVRYLQAQNSLLSAQENSSKSEKSGTEAFSAQAIGAKAGTIVANGILSFFGLENSIFSESNPYNKAINDLNGVTVGPPKADGQPGAYTYVPKNLPQSETQQTDDEYDGTVAPNAVGAGGVSGGGIPAVAYSPDGGVEQWRGTFAGVLDALGLPATWIGAGLAQMQTESGGNPKAINNWDSNAAAGIPSKGLMQVIDPTFQSYKSSKFPNDIWDPAANIGASLQYAADRYGDPQSVWGRGVGYDQGGIANGLGFMPKYTIKPERVLDPHQTETYDSMLPLLESLNVSQLMATNSGVGSVPFTAVGSKAPNSYDHSVHIHEPRLANLDDLVGLVNTKQAQQSAAALSAFGG